MSTVPLITISNRRPDPVRESYYHLDAFEASCKRQGIVPHFLEGTYRGLMSKPKLLLAYLKKDGAKFEHVVVCDAWDILLLTTTADLVYNYQVFNTPIVFNAERNCFPRADFREEFNRVNGQILRSYRFLNSGFLVGNTEAVITMLEQMELEKYPDDYRDDKGQWHGVNDQEVYQDWFLHKDKQTLATLDYNSILCQTLHDSEPREFAFVPDRQRVVSLLTGNEPGAVHGNGNGKEWLKRMIGWLNL